MITADSYRDRCCAKNESSGIGPYPKSMGEEVVARLAGCPDIHNGGCGRAGHRALYVGTPSTRQARRGACSHPLTTQTKYSR